MSWRKTALWGATGMSLLGIGWGAICMAADSETKAPWTAAREPAVAGSWYPGTDRELRETVDGYLAEADVSDLPGRPIAIISPHAGMRYSGPVAAYGFKTLAPHAFKRVILIGFSHRHRFPGASIPRVRAYRTPLGDLPLDRQAARGLLAHRLFDSYEKVHEREHSLEMQLPFLQRVAKGCRIVPICIGEMVGPEIDAVADAILPLLDEETVLVVSSDFTHYGPRFDYVPFKNDVEANLAKLDNQAARAITNVDCAAFSRYLMDTDATVCGRHPIRLLLRILEKRGGVQGRRLAYDTSGKSEGFTNSVSYLSIAFWDAGRKTSASRRGAKAHGHEIASLRTDLSDKQKQTLLRMARAEVIRTLGGDADPVDVTVAGKGSTGAFVTLTNAGALRGCIGRTGGQVVLSEAIRYAAQQACRDSRFRSNPVTLAELPGIHISITVLGPMEQIRSPEEIRIGDHGLKIVSGRRQGWLLPQVAFERCWNRREFFTHVCAKAGLPAGAWKRPDTQVYRFAGDVFGEENHGS